MSQRLSGKSRTQRVFDTLLWLFTPVGSLMNTVFVVNHTSCVHCSGGAHIATEQCENTTIIISHLRVATFVHKDVSTMQHIQMYTLHYTTPSHSHTPKHTTVHTRTPHPPPPTYTVESTPSPVPVPSSVTPPPQSQHSSCTSRSERTSP